MKGKFIKKVISVLISVVLVISIGAGFAAGSAAESADDGVMRPDMTAQQFAYDMGLGINLGNTMEAYYANNCESVTYTWPPAVGSNTPKDYEKYWGAPVTTQEIIDGMRDAGFKTVRIPVFWGNMMKNDGTFTINKEYIARVKEIVDYCRNDGLYAVINIHHFDEFIIRRHSLDECKVIFKNLWTQIANYFKDYSDYLVFEGYNEYLGGQQFDSSGNLADLSKAEGYNFTNTLNQAFVDAVRATGGNNATRLLIASGYWTNIDLTTKSNFKMPTDTAKDRLMVSVHYVDNSMYWTNKIGNDEWMQYSIKQCELLKKAFTDKGIPVFIGETTSVYPSDNFAGDATTKTSSEALDKMLRLITSYDFVPVLWDTNDNFYSRTQYKIKSSTDETVIKTLAAELDEKPRPTAPITKPSQNPSQEPSKNPSVNPTKTPTIVSQKPTVATTTKSTIVTKDKKVEPKVVKQAKVTKLAVNSKVKKKISVTWNKVKKAVGYQIQVSTKKTFKKSKIVINKFTTKKKITIKNKKIESGKTYYVRVRAYSTYKNADKRRTKVYSEWNYTVRTVKAK